MKLIVGHHNTVAWKAWFQARMRRHQFRVGHGDYAHFPRGRQLQTGVNRRGSPLSPFVSYPIVSRSKATTTTVIVVCIAISIIVVIVDNNNTDCLNVIYRNTGKSTVF